MKMTKLVSKIKQNLHHIFDNRETCAATKEA